MCGIAGFISVGKPGYDPEAVVARQARLLAHRGPDGEGTSVHAFGPPASGGCVALGHRRLRIIDLSENSRQPMASPAGDLALTYNGEIYNYLEIRGELAAKGHRFVSTGDVEVVLKAYEEWGTDCFAKFNGMWALAIYDGKRGKVVLSRDRFGKKPLYYLKAPGALIFASEIKSILTHPAAVKKPNYAKVLRFLAGNYRYVDCDEESFFEGVLHAPKSGWLEFDAGLGEKRGSYWKLDPDIPLLEISDDEAAERFRDLFVDSVKLRLRSDVPVGCMLSGGLDSTSIACVAYKILKQPIRTYSGVTGKEKGVYDESDYIDSVVREIGAESHYIKPDPADIFETVDEMLDYHDEPVCTVTWYSLYLIAKKVKLENTPVLLNGHGGDEIAGGYWDYYQYHFHDLERAGRTDELEREIRLWKENHGRDPAEMARYRDYIPKVLGGDLGEESRFPDNSGLFRRDFSERWRRRPELPNGYAGMLARRMFSDLWYETVPATLRPEDRNTMACSIESRSPMLDYRLAEFCARLPGRFKMRDGLGKWIIRRAMKGILPEDVRTRKDKAGFIAPADKWFRTLNRAQITDMIESGAFARRGIYEAGAVRRMFEEHLSERRDHQMVLWQLVNLESWFRKFFPV